MFTKENLMKLQSELTKDNVDAYLVFTTDPHDSEYAADYFLSERKYFCPFSGSAGQLVVLQNEAFLYTDGRYRIQAERELKDSGILLMKAGDPKTPRLSTLLSNKKVRKIGINLFQVNPDYLRNIEKRFEVVDKDYSYLVENRPNLSKANIFKLDDSLSTNTMEEKIEMVLKKTEEEGAEANLVTTLDDIAYILNLRSDDVPCNPVFYSYLYLSRKYGNHLFVDKDKLDFELKNIKIHDYNEVIEFLKAHSKVETLVDNTRVNAKLYRILDNPVDGRNPSFLMKAVKGPVEIENIKKIQAIDGIALLKFQKYLEENLDKNLSEFDYSEKLEEFRRSNPLCFELSFDTIAAVGPNAAQMHYEPTEKIHSVVSRNDIELLVDSGGQYYGGTTDTTRMFVLGKPTEEYKHDYTLTLKSVVALSSAIFLEGVNGHVIDMKARQFMWDEGLDYKCGTGHGVGYILNVHEGPNGFRPKSRPGVSDNDAIVPGMVTTVEPGVYKEGKYGIRIENNLLCVPAFETTDGKFFKFETVTYVPIDTVGLDLSMLTDKEIEWLNDYHELVYEKLAPLCDKELLEFLKLKTKKIVK